MAIETRAPHCIPGVEPVRCRCGMRTPSGTLAAIALAGVVLYAGLLRFDALFKSYGPYERPVALAKLQPVVHAAAARLTPDWRWRRGFAPYICRAPLNYPRV